MNLRRTRICQVSRHDDRAGGTGGLEFHRRLHARWHVGTNDSPEAKARKEPFRSRGQEIDGRRSSLVGKVQGGSDDLISKAVSFQRFLHGDRSKQRPVRIKLQSCTCHNLIVESYYETGVEMVKQALPGQPVVGE